MCAYIALIAIILAVILWCIDNAAALRCNGYEFESLLTGLLEMYRVVYTGGANFFKFINKIDQSKMTKTRMFNRSLKLNNHKSFWVLFCSCI